jgi:uroporphyrinogen-III synthase
MSTSNISTAIPDTKTQETRPLNSSVPIPVLLLKTRTIPNDPYETLLSCSSNNNDQNTTIGHPLLLLKPHFLPVLTHSYTQTSLSKLANLFNDPSTLTKTYGGIILTSQRAVEALDYVLSTLPEPVKKAWKEWLSQAHPDASTSTPLSTGVEGSDLEAGNKAEAHTPWQNQRLKVHFYVVGPATASAVQALASRHIPHASIDGAQTGTGEKLASHILAKYLDSHSQHNGHSSTTPSEPQPEHQGQEENEARLSPLPFLFITGETRRDTVPRMLSAAGMRVDEIAVYETVTRTEFRDEFRQKMDELDSLPYFAQAHTSATHARERKYRWIVVFSPQGCADVLQELGWMESSSASSAKISSSSSTSDDGNNGNENTKHNFVKEQFRLAQSRRRMYLQDVMRPEENELLPTRTLIMSIGPTTKAFFKEKFLFEVDVCAAKPSPEGVLEGVLCFDYSDNDAGADNEMIVSG